MTLDSHASIATFRRLARDECSDIPKPDGEEGRRLKEQVDEEVVLPMEEVVGCTVQQEYPHRHLQRMDPVRFNSTPQKKRKEKKIKACRFDTHTLDLETRRYTSDVLFPITFLRTEAGA